VCFEATCGYGYLYDELAKIAERVVMAHPGQLRLIFRSKRKSDRVDALKLAKLLYLDEVPAAHVPDQDVREWRELIEFRRRLVDRRTSVKCQIRSLLRTYGVYAPKGLWSRSGVAWLKEQSFPTLTGTLRRDMLLTEYVVYHEKVKAVTKVLNGIARQHPGVQLLRTIPGVGARTAEAVMAYVDRAARFRRANQMSSYFGLVPCQDASAGKNRLGHITKQGPATARKYLVEATWQGVRRSPTIRAHYERIVGGKKDRGKLALVGTTQWLVRCMFSMLRTGEAWREAA